MNNRLFSIIRLLLAAWLLPLAASNAQVTPTNEVEQVATNDAAVAEAASDPATSKPEPEPTIVTSEKLNVDYLSNVGTFEGNVLVVDPRISVRADKMVVKFGGVTGGDKQESQSKTNMSTQSLERIDARGGVVITQTDKKATSENAVYTAADGKVVLTGNPQVEGPDGTVTGEKITFWRDDKRMDVESSTRLILYPELDKKKEKEKFKEKVKDLQKPLSGTAPADTNLVPRVKPGLER